MRLPRWAGWAVYAAWAVALTAFVLVTRQPPAVRVGMLPADSMASGVGLVLEGGEMRPLLPAGESTTLVVLNPACEYCTDRRARIAREAERFGTDNLIYIATGDSASARAYLQTLAGRSARRYTVPREVVEALGVAIVPTFIVVREDGRIVLWQPGLPGMRARRAARLALGG